MPQPSNPLSGKEPLLYTAGDQTAKFIISRNPKLDTMTFDPKQYQSRIATVASNMDVTDVTFGFDTAINIVIEAIDRLRTTSESHRRVMVVETMGLLRAAASRSLIRVPPPTTNGQATTRERA